MEYSDEPVGFGTEPGMDNSLDEAREVTITKFQTRLREQDRISQREWDERHPHGYHRPPSQWEGGMNPPGYTQRRGPRARHMNRRDADVDKARKQPKYDSDYAKAMDILAENVEEEKEEQIVLSPVGFEATQMDDYMAANGIDLKADLLDMNPVVRQLVNDAFVEANENEKLPEFEPPKKFAIHPQVIEKYSPQSEDVEVEEVDLAVLSPKCRARVSKQRDRKKQYASLYKRLAREGQVFEFGRQIDLSDESEAAAYLHHVDIWLWSIFMPQDYGRCRDFAFSYVNKKPYRKIVIAILASKKNVRAQIWNKFYNHSIGKKEFDHLARGHCGKPRQWLDNKKDIEAQGFSNVSLLVAAAGVAISGFGGYAGWKFARSSHVEKAVKVMDLMALVSSGINTVRDLGSKVWDWLRTAVKKIKEAFTCENLFAQLLVRGILTTLVTVLALEVMRTVLGTAYSAGRDFLLSKMQDKGIQTQGFGDELEEERERDPLRYCLEVVRTMFAIPTSRFWMLCDKLPKIKNMAQSIEYLLDHAKDLYYWIYEALTGKVCGRTARERDILAFSERVCELRAVLQQGISEEVFSTTTAALETACGIEKKRLEMAATRKHSADRPYFGHLLARMGEIYQKCAIELETRRLSAKERPVPVFVHFYGDPGTGKSKLTRPLLEAVWRYVKHYQEERKIIVDLDSFGYHCVFNFNPQEEFFDGYHNQFFVLIDDLFQMLDVTARAKASMNLISMISPTPYSLRVATVEQKSHTYFTSRCIISTTNVQDLRVESLGIQDTSAVESRITFGIHLHKDGKMTLDQELNGKKGEEVTFGQLVSLIGEAILERHDQVGSNADATLYPRFACEFKSARLAFKREADKEKGKEKEIEAQSGDGDKPWEEQCHMDDDFPNVVPPERLEAFMEMMGSRDLDKEEEHLSDFQWFMKNQTQLLRVARHPYIVIVNERVIGNFEEEKEMFDFLNVWMDRYPNVSYCVQDFREMVPDEEEEEEPICFMLSLKDDEVIGENEHGRVFSMPRDIWEDESFWDQQLKREEEKDRQTQGFEDEASSSKPKETEEREPYGDWDRFADRMNWFSNQFNRPVPGSWCERVDDWIIRHLLWSPQKWAEKAMDKPHVYLPKMTNIRYERIRSAWAAGETGESEAGTHMMIEWLKSIPPTSDDPEWWQQAIDCILQKWEGKLVDLEDVKKIYEYSNVRNSWTGNVLRFFGGFALGFVAIKALFAFLPKSCHKEVQGYDIQPKREVGFRKQGRLAHKAARNVRLKRMVTGAQGNYHDKYYRMMQNQDIIDVKITSRQMHPIEAEKLDPQASTWVLFVWGRTFLTPLHPIFELGDEDDERFLTFRKHGKKTFNVKELRLVAELGGDLALFELPKVAEVQEHKDLINYFWDGIGHPTPIHVLPHAHDTGYDTETCGSWSMTINRVPTRKGYPCPEENGYELDMQFNNSRNEKGMCGTLWCDVTTGQIMGIHNGGSPSYAESYALRTLIQDMREYHDVQPPQYAVLDPIKVELTVAEGMEGVSARGKLPNSHAVYLPTDTALVNTPFRYEKFPFPETKDGPAMLKNCREKSIYPLRQALDKFGKQGMAGAGPRPLMSLKDFLPRGFNPSRIRRLTLEEAVYGVRGWIKGVDMTKSVGYHYKKLGFRSRKELFPGNQDNPIIHPIVRADVEYWYREAEKNNIVPAVFEETLKDEIRDAERVAQGKTRLFSACDLRTQLVTKMEMGAIVAELEVDPSGCPNTLGMNVHSGQWGRMYSRLRGRPEERRRPLAGDFSSFDISIKILYAFIRFCQVYAVDGKHSVLIEMVILANFRGAWHIIVAFVFVRPWGNASGSWLTSIFNTFVNWYIHKQAFRDLFSEEEWEEWIVSYFHGDDSVLSVPERYSAYNMEYLQKWFWENYHMEYTSPTKTSKMTMEWDDVTFLKRRFVVGELGIMAPLPADSMANMVKWTTKGYDDEVLESTLRSVMVEAFHFGREKYEECFAWCVSEARRMGKGWIMVRYDDMVGAKRSDY